MSQLQLRHIESIDELRRAAPAWDRLWQRSDVSLPTVRAELVAQWLERFASRSAPHVLLVERNGEFAAALPLVGRRTGGVVHVGDLTSNHWSPNGELLLDPEADTVAVLGMLAGALEDLPWPLLWLDLVPCETPRWKALIETLADRGLSADVHPRYRIGQVEIGGDFEQYDAQRSANSRRAVRKRLRHLARDGPVRVEFHRTFTPDEVDDLLRRAFEIERLSWKNETGRPVLDEPGMFDFYRRQARQLAEWGYLRLAFLEHRHKPIAFEVGWTAKGVYHSFKVGYDASYRRHGPGHLLRHYLIKRLHEQPGHTLIDFQGPLSDALLSWSTRSYPIARLVMAPRGSGGRALFAGYKTVVPAIRGLRAATDWVTR